MKKLILITAILSATFNSLNSESTSTKFYPEVIIKSKQIIIKVTATMYNASVQQCDDTPLITAGNYHINPTKASQQKYIAVSRDLLKIFKYGDKVKITHAGHKNGIYRITDTMAKRYVNRIDFLETEGTALYKLEDVILTKI